jgi:hypothetical protein
MVEARRKEGGMIPIGKWLMQLPEVPNWHGFCEEGDTVRESADQSKNAQLLMEAQARGRAEAEAEFKLQFEAAATAAQQNYAQLLNEERQKWLQEEILPLTERFGLAIENLGLNLSDSIACVLRPFLSEAVREKALTEFKSMLESHLASGDGALVRLRAPRDILDTVAPNLQRSGRRIEMAEAVGCDIIMEAGPSSFQTQIGVWLEAIGVASHGG